MKIKREVVIIVTLILVIGFIGGFLMYTLFTISAPDVHLDVDILEVTDDFVEIELNININNQNPFSIEMSEVDVEIFSMDDIRITTFSLNGGHVDASSNERFHTEEQIPFSNNMTAIFDMIATGDLIISYVGVITKDVPYRVTSTISLEDIVESFEIPHITITGEITNITQDGIIFDGRILVENNNTFSLALSNIDITAETDDETQVGTFTTVDTTLPAKASEKIYVHGLLDYEAFEIGMISFIVHGQVGVTIAGINISRSLNASASVEMPDIETFLFHSESMKFSITAEFKLRLRGIIVTAGFRILNPTDIPLLAQDLQASIFSENRNNETTLLVSQDMEPCRVFSNKEVCVNVELIVPYLKLLSSESFRILPKWIIITINGNLTIDGTNQIIPISINGFIDLHFLQ